MVELGDLVRFRITGTGDAARGIALIGDDGDKGWRRPPVFWGIAAKQPIMLEVTNGPACIL